MKHCPSHGAERQFEGGDLTEVEEEICGLLEDYETNYQALKQAQDGIDAWVEKFVGMKVGDILERGRGVRYNGLFCAIPEFHMRDGFTGWRKGRQRVRVESFTAKTNSKMGNFPVMEIMARCIPLKEDGSDMSCYCNATIDLRQAALVIDGREMGHAERIAEYVSKVIEMRNDEGKP